MKGIVVIETIDPDGTLWGVSLCGPNPEVDKYIECESQAEANQVKGALDVEYVACPFCGDVDFDHIGLKQHLTLFCQAYNKL